MTHKATGFKKGEGIIFFQSIRDITRFPISSYWFLVTHISSKVLKEATIDPPIHALIYLSGGDTVRSRWEEGSNEDNSFLILSSIPGNCVLFDIVYFAREARREERGLPA